MDSLVREVRRAYHLWEPFNSVQVSLSEFLRTSDLSSCDALQSRLAQELLRSDRAKRCPVEPEAGRRFLRRLTVALEEKEGLEIDEGFYDAASSVTVEDDDGAESEEKFWYKTYFLGGGEEEDRSSSCASVSLAETREMLSSGTTGLRTWEAAGALIRWARRQRGNRHGRRLEKGRVLELGSGPGLVGLGLRALGLCCGGLVVTDAHPEVLRRLRHNAEANGGQDSVEVRELDWATFGEEGSEELEQLDLVVASDVVFDPSIVGPLAGSISALLAANAGRGTPAVVACTVRNERTLDMFEKKLEERGLLSEVADKDGSVRIYEITRP